MAKDFRKIERLLEDFFRSRGIGGTHVHGDLMLGVCSTELEGKRTEDGTGTTVRIIVPEDHACGFVSLSDLAEELAEELA